MRNDLSNGYLSAQTSGEGNIALKDISAQQLQAILQTLKLPSAKQALAGVTGADLSQATDIADLVEIGISQVDTAALSYHLEQFKVNLTRPCIWSRNLCHDSSKTSRSYSISLT